MLQTMYPIFGDLVLRGVMVLSFLFVLGLVLDAWWQKRQVRLMRELSKRQSDRPARPATRLHVFFKRFRRKFVALLAVVSIVIAVLFLGRKNINARAINSTDESSIAAYATNFQGDATRPVPMEGTNPLDFGDTNLSGNPNWIHAGKVPLSYGTDQSPSPAGTSMTNVDANALGMP